MAASGSNKRHLNISGDKFTVNGGLASQFLKADGTLDSTGYLPLTGGTLTGATTILGNLSMNNTQINGVGSIVFNDVADTSNEGIRFPLTTGSSDLWINPAGEFRQDTNLIWHDGNLTNVSQLANDAGYALASQLHTQNTDTGTNAVVFTVNQGGTPTLGSGIQWTSSTNNPYIRKNEENHFEFYKDWTTGERANLNASKFVKFGGTSTQFLKADGSVDTNTYLTSTTGDSAYVKKTGDTMTGSLSSTDIISPKFTHNGDVVTKTNLNQSNDILNINGDTIFTYIEDTWTGSAWSSGAGSFGIGRNSMTENIGEWSYGVGEWSMYQNTGDSSVGIGDVAMYANTGYKTIGIGAYAGGENTGSYSTFLGDDTGAYNTGDYAVFIGSGVGEFSSGIFNTFMGTSTGVWNGGDYTTGIGLNSAISNKGDNGIFIGSESGAVNIGEKNIGIGYEAMHYGGGTNNIGIGTSSFKNETKDYVNKKIFTPSDYTGTGGIVYNPNNIRINLTNHGYTIGSFITAWFESADPNFTSTWPNQFEVLDANTLRFTQYNSGVNATPTSNVDFIPVKSFNDVSILGSGLEPERNNQTILGGLSVKVPNATIAEIDSVGAKALITKEWYDNRYTQISNDFLPRDGSLSMTGDLNLPLNNNIRFGNQLAIKKESLGSLIFYGGTSNGFSFNGWNGSSYVPVSTINNSGDVEATSFIKSGGTSTQFLKADGSVDSSTYLTSTTGDLAYVKKTGDTMTGNLGIGVDPLQKLHVNGNIRLHTGTQNIQFTNDNVGLYRDVNDLHLNGYGNVIIKSSATTMSSQVERMRITSAGNVGIGTTTPATKLEIVGSTSGSLVHIQNQTSTGYAGVELRKINNDWGSFFGYQESSDHMRYNVKTGYHNFLTNSIERVRITNAGKVGIGTTTPTETLDVNGTFKTDALWTTSTSITQWGSNGTASGTLTWDTDYAKIYSASGKSLQFGSGNATSRLSIDNTGKVGIGTTTPVTTLDVAGDVQIVKTDTPGETIFDIQGSAGQLFSITDSLEGDLFSVNDISGLPILTVNSEDRVEVNGSLNIKTGEGTGLTTDVTIAVVDSTLYKVGHFDYYVEREDVPGLRTGTVMAIHDGTNVSYVDTSTNDLGGTTDSIDMVVDLVGGELRLRAIITAGTWTVKAGTRTL